MILQDPGKTPGYFHLKSWGIVKRSWQEMKDFKRMCKPDTYSAPETFTPKGLSRYSIPNENSFLTASEVFIVRLSTRKSIELLITLQDYRLEKKTIYISRPIYKWSHFIAYTGRSCALQTLSKLSTADLKKSIYTQTRNRTLNLCGERNSLKTKPSLTKASDFRLKKIMLLSRSI